MVALRAETETRRSEESATKLEGDRLRAEMATLTGRRNSLQSLIREHSYSTDTVRKLLKSNSLGGGLAPVGTLADFLEVNGEYETVVDSFLRDELNYIVVQELGCGPRRHAPAEERRRWAGNLPGPSRRFPGQVLLCR